MTAWYEDAEALRFLGTRRKLRRNAPLTERIIILASGCWLWMGGQSKKRSGTIYGAMKWKGRVRPAHVVYYEEFVGLVLPGFQVHHVCPLKLCVAPSHLQSVPGIVNETLGSRSRAEKARDDRATVSEACVGQVNERSEEEADILAAYEEDRAGAYPPI